jgi:aspartate racemase
VANLVRRSGQPSVSANRLDALGNNKKLGILGGMGPLASAEFLSTIYRLNLVEPEQEAPNCVLLSDPSFPDRTEAILAGTTGALVSRLEASLQELVCQGADRIVIACVTIHHVLPQICEPLRQRVASLLDLMVEGVLAAPRPRLLLATTGTRRARLFESHKRWGEISPWVVLPGEDDQRTLHEWIYGLKAGRLEEDDCLAWMESLPERYGVVGVLFGCTELHLLQRRIMAGASTGLDIIDPLWIAARDLRGLLNPA